MPSRSHPLRVAAAGPLLIIALAAALVPSVARAQARVALSPFIATEEALPGTPTVVGLSITSFTGITAFRVGGAFGDLREGAVDTFGRRHTEVGAWTADADVLFVPTRHPNFQGIFGGFEPAAYVGLGLLGRQDAALRSHNTATMSYGGLISQRLVGGLRGEVELRYRRPLQIEDATRDGIGSGWEYRAGLSFHFGGRDARPGRPPRGGWGLSTIGRATSARPISPPLPLPSGRPTASRVLSTADHYVGTRYTYGGDSPAEGFDCSGFVRYVFRQHGVTLPRTSRQMASAGDRLAPAIRHLRRGDLVLFAGNGTRIDHVGIYAGGNRIVHASSSGRGVRYDDLTTARGRWFVAHMVAARRVIADGHSLVDAFAEAALAAAPVVLDPPDRAPAP